MNPRRLFSTARLFLPLASALAALFSAQATRGASDSRNMNADGNRTTFGGWLSGTPATNFLRLQVISA